MTRCAPGKSMRVAVETGWARARNTCLAADVGVAARRGRALHLHDRRGQGLRVRARDQHRDRPHRVLLVHQADGHPAWPGCTFFNSGSRLLRALAARPSASTSRPRTSRRRRRGGLMGKFSRTRQRALRGRRLDRLRRPQVALVRHLRRHRAARGGRPVLQGPQPRHRVRGRRRVQRLGARRRGHPGQRRQDPRRRSPATGIEDAASPIVNTSGTDASGCRPRR